MHPLCGTKVKVVRGFGPGAVWVELPDGTRRIVPIEWTDLRPRVDVAAIVACAGVRPVRLAPGGLHALACWVAARGDVGAPSVRHETQGIQTVMRELGTSGWKAEDRGTDSSSTPDAIVAQAAVAAAQWGVCAGGPGAAAAALVWEVGPPEAPGGSVREGGGVG